jgi:hypothetical protein
MRSTIDAAGRLEVEAAATPLRLERRDGVLVADRTSRCPC